MENRRTEKNRNVERLQKIAGGILIIITGIIFPSLTFGQVLFSYDSSISVRMNGLKLTNAWAGGLNAGQFGLVDLNGDGIDDLVVYDRSSNLLNTFIRKDGKYCFSPEYRAFFPQDIEGWILFRDYDCDGLRDIFTYATGGMRVFRNITPAVGYLKWELIADPVLTLSASGVINLQLNITDIPAIDDIDGDGDLDILVYNFAIGGFIRHHLNRSIEKTGKCGALDFELVDREWGSFEECECMDYAFESLGESCSDTDHGRIMHPGGKSLLLLDMDHDGDMDFLGGHEQCDELYYLENTGTPEKALMTSFTASFPDALNPATFSTFPAAYKDDFDYDGTFDLLVAPNAGGTFNRTIDYTHSSWFYRNEGSGELPEFRLLTRSFLQQDMIDLGANAVPVLVDADGDGDLDLFVGANGKPSGGEHYGYLTFLRNTGDPLAPEFILDNDDYLDLSHFAGYDLYPLFADMNRDQSPDLIVILSRSGDGKTEARLFLNKAGPGRGVSFDPSAFQAIDLPVFPNDAPHFTDMNSDGLPDLLVGKTTGRLEYYMNTGSPGQPYFELSEPAYLGIDDDFITFRRNLVPFVADFDHDGEQDLITSDYTGELTLYSHFKHNPEKTSSLLFNTLRQSAESFLQGYKTWITGGLLYADENPVLMLGNIQGGVTIYRNELERSHGETDALSVQIYPNPSRTGDLLRLRANREGYAAIYNSRGQLLAEPVGLKAFISRSVDIGHLSAGLYIMKFLSLDGRNTSVKFIRQ